MGHVDTGEVTSAAASGLAWRVAVILPGLQGRADPREEPYVVP